MKRILKFRNLNIDFSTPFRKDLNIHMVKEHKNKEQIDGNISLNSTDIKGNYPETSIEDEPVS